MYECVFEYASSLGYHILGMGHCARCWPFNIIHPSHYHILYHSCFPRARYSVESEFSLLHFPFISTSIMYGAALNTFGDDYRNKYDDIQCWVVHELGIFFHMTTEKSHSYTRRPIHNYAEIFWANAMKVRSFYLYFSSFIILVFLFSLATQRN